MQFDRRDDIRGARVAAGRLYQEFLRTPSMSAGLYELPAGSTDPQQPHAQDELYYVVAGAATFDGDGDGDGERHQVGPGDTIFVDAGVPHRFVEITEDLSMLVVFAPAEGDAPTSRGQQGSHGR